MKERRIVLHEAKDIPAFILWRRFFSLAFCFFCNQIACNRKRFDPAPGKRNLCD